ncbi:extracellular calcium-sensing receptor-like [Heptranchias perlo]|uniref:extracellular calcium-sensing receptor-like n=1 Tax=Heptranchias perlo TaxID=212740 RepID=UPI0035593809
MVEDIARRLGFIKGEGVITHLPGFHQGHDVDANIRNKLTDDKGFVHKWGTSQPVCKLRGRFNLPGLYKDGDIVMGGIFHFHHHVVRQDEPHSFTVEPQSPGCENFNLREFHQAQTMIFAIEEINTSSKLLPNVTLGYKIYDGCNSETLSVKAVMALIGMQNESTTDSSCTPISRLPAIIADAGFIRSLSETMLTAPFGIPTVSFSATCKGFGDLEFATLFETMPSDSHQMSAIASLVKHFGWNWIGLIRSSSNYSSMQSEAILQALTRVGICIAFSEAFSETDSREKVLKVVNTIKRATTKIIIALATLADMEVLLQEVVRQNVTGIQWLGSHSWITIPILSPAENARFLAGALGFVVPKARIAGLKEFLLQVNPYQSPENPLVNEFWEETFDCAMQNVTRSNPQSQARQCTGNELLHEINNQYTDTSQLRVSYRVYEAVYAIAHALHNMLSCGNNGCANMSDFESRQLLYHLDRLNSTDMNGSDVHSHQNENWVPKYELVNWQISASGVAGIVSVGKYDKSALIGRALKINEQAIFWTDGRRKVPRGICSESCSPGTRKATRRGEPVCCFDCVKCVNNDISNVTDALSCMTCPLEYWPNQYRNGCILKEIEFLSFDDGLGCVLATFAVGGACLTIATTAVFYKYRHTPLVRANNSELSFIILLSLVLCFLCALPFIADPSHWSCMLRFTVFGVTFALCLAGILGKTVVALMAFKSKSPKNHMMKWFNPRRQRTGVFILALIQCLICILWITRSPPFPFKTPTYYQHVISLECQVGSVAYFCAVFVLIFLLTGVTLVFAFLARKLPDSFNEATHITFSLLTFCAVWITFFPVYVSAPEKYAAAVQVFAILASSFSLLLCIFAPKCYIILLKPEMNTRKYVMNTRRNK